MILTNKDLKEITFGAISYNLDGEGFSACRFSKEQQEYMYGYKKEFYSKTFSSASMCIDFTTDSENLSFGYEVSNFATRNFYYFDIYENDTLICHAGCEDGTERGGTVTVKLSAGNSRVRIYPPNMQKAVIFDFTLDDGASVTPTKKGTRALILGDSITQGYDARYPSLSYANLLIEAFSLNAVNQAIGGEVFNPDGLGDTPVFNPEIITVAYGINDWSKNSGKPDFDVVDAYFVKLKNLYPEAKIIYISPIWTNPGRKPDFHHTLAKTIERYETIAKSHGITVVQGYDFVGHDLGFFTDGLHPNDLGFTLYAKGLVREIKKTGLIK